MIKTVFAILTLAGSSAAFACPSLKGTWVGGCRGPGTINDQVTLVIEQESCMAVKITYFVNSVMSKVDNIRIGVPISNFSFSPQSEGLYNSGSIGAWRFQFMLQIIEQSTDASLAGVPQEIGIYFHDKSFTKFGERGLSLTDQQWHYRIADPQIIPWETRQWALNRECSFEKSEDE